MNSSLSATEARIAAALDPFFPPPAPAQCPASAARYDSTVGAVVPSSLASLSHLDPARWDPSRLYICVSAEKPEVWAAMQLAIGRINAQARREAEELMTLELGRATIEAKTNLSSHNNDGDNSDVRGTAYGGDDDDADTEDALAAAVAAEAVATPAAVSELLHLTQTRVSLVHSANVRAVASTVSAIHRRHATNVTANSGNSTTTAAATAAASGSDAVHVGFNAERFLHVAKAIEAGTDAAFAAASSSSAAGTGAAHGQSQAPARFGAYSARTHSFVTNNVHTNSTSNTSNNSSSSGAAISDGSEQSTEAPAATGPLPLALCGALACALPQPVTAPKYPLLPWSQCLDPATMPYVPTPRPIVTLLNKDVKMNSDYSPLNAHSLNNSNSNSSNADGSSTGSATAVVSSQTPPSALLAILGTPGNAYWNLLWTWRHSPLDTAPLLAFQKVNHFSRSCNLTRKAMLSRNISRYAKLCEGSPVMRRWFEFIPRTFTLPLAAQPFLERYYDRDVILRAEEWGVRLGLAAQLGSQSHSTNASGVDAKSSGAQGSTGESASEGYGSRDDADSLASNPLLAKLVALLRKVDKHNATNNAVHSTSALKFSNSAANAAALTAEDVESLGLALPLRVDMAQANALYGGEYSWTYNNNSNSNGTMGQNKSSTSPNSSSSGANASVSAPGDSSNTVRILTSATAVAAAVPPFPSPRNVWIIKPINSSRGRGIYLTNKLAHMPHSGAPAVVQVRCNM